MASLKDQLLKAGLVSKKDARKAGAEKRAERLAEGKRSSDVEAEAEERRRALYEARLAEQQARDRAREDERQRAQDQKDAANRAINLMDAHRVAFRGGDRRWHFVCRDRVIRWIAVPDPVAQRLEGGSAAIVEDPRRGAVIVVAAEAAEACAETLPDRVLFWNRRT